MERNPAIMAESNIIENSESQFFNNWIESLNEAMRSPFLEIKKGSQGNG
jgi:hypothetical protein